MRGACSDAFLDCHLMVTNPNQWIDEFAAAGASSITFHIEATVDPVETIALIRKTGCRVGVAIKPNTNIGSIRNLIDLVDMVLVMTVEPGFGGQKMII